MPKRIRLKKRILLPVILLAALLAGVGFYCRPFAFPDLTQAEGPIRVTCIHVLPSIWEDYAVLPQSETKTLTVEPDSPEAAAVAEVLSRYSYHRCLKTLSRDTGIHSNGSNGANTLYLFTPTSVDLDFFGCRHLWIDGRVYHVGWWGDARGNRLTAELIHVLGLT